MRMLLKKVLPRWLKNLILKTIRMPDLWLSLIFKSSRFSASIYYAFFSRKFSREHKAVLAGKVAYEKNLKIIGKTSALLRRNIHRLEKGLIMQPRRDVFAEGFITETVKIYSLASSLEGFDCDEKKWARDVLLSYFNIVKDTNTISKARYAFNQVVPDSEDVDKFIPKLYKELVRSNVGYDELHYLFLKRRSVRWYIDKPVPMELIEKAIKSAILAPSACNRQPYSFFISKDKSKAIEIAKCAGGTAGWAENIPCTIAIIGDLSSYTKERDRHLIYIDGALAAMQLMLSFETLGLATCSINWPDIESAENKMQKLLFLKKYQRPVMLLSVGYAQEEGGVPYSQKKNIQSLIKKV
jgi:nitroreductase